MDIKIIQETCCAEGCGINYWITQEHHDRLVSTKRTFHCPNGHPQSYQGESDRARIKSLEATRDFLERENTKKDDEVVLYKGEGCDFCGHSGYSGRVGIFEVLPVSPKIASLILSRTDAAGIEKQAVLEGMVTMKQDGYLKALEGTSTIDEILRVAQE